MKKNEVAVQTALPSEPAVTGGADRGSTRVKSPAITAPDRTRTDAPLVAECWVGIDVAKAHLDVAMWPTVERLRVTRDEAGLAELTGGLQPRTPTRIVLEATGGLETWVAGRLIEAQFPTAVINPRQALLLRPWATWPRRTPWMPGCWPGLARAFSPNPVPGKTKRPRR
ncbi:MAG: IS110 family transposase [Synechococcaceae cyanobacterium SM1_2_3]|nr:IS110 family transposase [Synechococcaceae cyanobacterium SM1_2_3]